MGLKLISPPAVDPVTLIEAKAHLRVVDSDDDTYISALIKSATGNTEAWLGRALIDQTWDLYLDAFPTTGNMEIEIPKPPLIDIVQIEYDDSNGDQQFVSSGDYYIDSVTEPGWLVPQGTLTWPTPIDAINSVRVRFRAGYLDTNSPPNNLVPGDIKAGILLTIGSMYENREEMIVGTIGSRLPHYVENILRPHRVLLGMA